MNLTENQLQNWLQQILTLRQAGELPVAQLPLLAVSPELQAVQLLTLEGQRLVAGSRGWVFPLMSVVKPFLLLYLLEHLGLAVVRQRVGIAPSDLPFNSLAQLHQDRGWPRNPMLNSGALVLCDQLVGATPTERCQSLQTWLEAKSGCRLMLDQDLLARIEASPNPYNCCLVDTLADHGRLTTPRLTLATYNRICCLGGTVETVAQLGLQLLLVKTSVASQHQELVREVMLNCGLYESSSRYAIRLGWPIKSGVSGVLLALVPELGAIAVYSPGLDEQGNSAGGLWLLEQIAQANSGKV